MLGRVAAAFFAAFSLFADPLLGRFPMRWAPRMLHLAISGAGCSCFHSFCQSVQIVSVLASKSEIDEGSQLLGKPSHPVPQKCWGPGELFNGLSPHNLPKTNPDKPVVCLDSIFLLV